MIKKHGYYVGSLVIILCVVFMVTLRLWHETTRSDQELSRAQLRKVIDGLRLGMTRQDVYQVFEQKEWTAFSKENGEIRLSTKPQPLPEHWIVRLFFEDDRLTSVRFGSADNIDKRPHDAPPDMWEASPEKPGPPLTQ